MSNSNQAFANMTMNVRQELCAVMVFAVVDKAGSIVMENEEEVGFDSGFFCAFVKLPLGSSGCSSIQTSRSWTVSEDVKISNQVAEWLIDTKKFFLHWYYLIWQGRIPILWQKRLVIGPLNKIAFKLHERA